LNRIVSGTEAGSWLEAARTLLATIEETQSEPVEAASRICAEAIAGDGLVHLFGTGHSRIPVEEMFPRYGSYPGFNPMVELSMTYHTEVVGSNGQRQAMFIERTEGLAEVILANRSSSSPRGSSLSRASPSTRRARGSSTTRMSCSTCARRPPTRSRRPSA
jgi:hypothetical protein